MRENDYIVTCALFFILANIWYAVTGTCWTIKRTLAERIECFGFSEALIEMAFLLYLGFM